MQIARWKRRNARLLEIPIRFCFCIRHTLSQLISAKQKKKAETAIFKTTTDNCDKYLITKTRRVAQNNVLTLQEILKLFFVRLCSKTHLRTYLRRDFFLRPGHYFLYTHRPRSSLRRCCRHLRGSECSNDPLNRGTFICLRQQHLKRRLWTIYKPRSQDHPRPQLFFQKLLKLL